MNNFFTFQEGTLLILLFTSHLLADFIFATDKNVALRKEGMLKSQAFWLHGLCVLVVTWLINRNSLSWSLLVVIVISHLIIDYLKLLANRKITVTQWKQKELGLFVIDQALHASVLIIVWVYMIDGFSRMQMAVSHFANNYNILLKFLGYLIA
ncbi:MAG: DUF3307 domain-containing protein, partial [Bacteroidota bacterium]